MSACSLGDGAGAVFQQLAQDAPSIASKAGAKTVGQDIVDVPGKALNWLGNRQNDQKVSTTVLSAVYANVSTDFSLTCSGNAIVSQGFTLDCDKPPSPDNPGCVTAHAVMDDDAGSVEAQALNLVYNANQLRIDAVRIRGGVGGPTYDIGTCTPGTECGAWKANTQPTSIGFACTNCQATDISQANHIKFEASCNSAVNVNNYVNDHLKEKVDQLLSNTKDLSGELGGVLSGGSRQCIATSITNRIKQKSTTEVTARLLEQIAVQQTLDIQKGSSSVYISNVKQWTNVNSVASLVSNVGITTQLFSDEETKVAQALINKNANLEDLLNDVGDITVGFVDLVTGAGGWLIIALIALAALGLILGLVFFGANPEIYKKTTKDAAARLKAWRDRRQQNNT